MLNAELALVVHLLTGIGLFAGCLLLAMSSLKLLTMGRDSTGAARIGMIVLAFGIILLEPIFFTGLGLLLEGDFTWANWKALAMQASVGFTSGWLALGIVIGICYALYRAVCAALNAMYRHRTHH